MKPPCKQIPYSRAAAFIKRMKARGWGGSKYKAIRTTVEEAKF